MGYKKYKKQLRRIFDCDFVGVFQDRFLGFFIRFPLFLSWSSTTAWVGSDLKQKLCGRPSQAATDQLSC